MSTSPVQPIDHILPHNIRYDTDAEVNLYDDEAAVRLVLDDVQDGHAWLNEQNWAASWSDSYQLQQSPTSQSCFDGGNPFSASVPNFTVSNTVATLVPKIMQALFYETPPFLLRPRPGTTADIVTLKTALFAYQLEDMEWESQCELTLDQQALIGTGVMKWGFLEETRYVKKYVRKGDPQVVKTPDGKVFRVIHTEESDDFDIEFQEVKIARPWCHYVDRRCVYTNRGLRFPDITKAKWVVYRDYATYDDLNGLRGKPGYTIPSEEELKDWFMRQPFTPEGDALPMAIPESMRGWLQQALPRNMKDSADPLQNGLEIIERWDGDKVIVILRHGDDNILIRNEVNPYRHIRGGKNAIPFLSANWRNIGNCFDGQGIGILNGSNQLVSQGITDMSLTLLSYGLNPTAVRTQGFNTPSQDIVWSAGGIIDVEGDVDKAFKFLEFPQPPASAMQWLMQQQSDAAASSGANENFGLGAASAGIKSTGARSGTGAALVGQANASRLDGPAGRFVRQVFVPWLQIMDELNNDRLPSSVLRDVLGKQLGQQVELDHIQFRGAELQYEVLAGAKLGPKKEMAQFFPFLIQLINNPTFATLLNVAGYKFDVVAAFKNFADMAGWKYAQSFVVKMSPQEQAKADAQLPSAIAASKAKNDQEAMVAQFQLEEKKEASKQLGKAGAEVLRTAVEHGMDTDPMAQPFTGTD